ncbi:hypothetical protein KQX54_001851 [Cotesia glomerata]|uniref:Uncharacterized protein n=1 Tax=Cotesia glomerata TaxID=32391 RepID=A0AAV7HUN3_COTGL|nr:hypothetical protein KQX54_001851 [Cotesia glomerata]
MCAYTRSATKNKNKIKAGKYRADYDADSRSEIASNEGSRRQHSGKFLIGGLEGVVEGVSFEKSERKQAGYRSVTRKPESNNNCVIACDFVKFANSLKQAIPRL